MDFDDHYEFRVQDDLSGLDVFTIRADAAVVTRPNLKEL